MPTRVPRLETTITPAHIELPSKKRVISLDVFRGITIAAMILVNDPGDRDHVYWSLKHSRWNGCTPTDLVFPFFLFIAGVSMVLSFESRRREEAGRRSLMWHAAKRSAIIFFLGLFLNAFPLFDVHTVRVLGVLQRIALVYLVTSALVIYSGKAARAMMLIVTLVGYWLLMTTVPVPGYGAGVLTVDGSLASYVDRALLYNHLYSPHQFDPEGFLSTIPAIATCLIGVLVGEWLRHKSNARLISSLLAGSVISISLGYLWNSQFPINKKLWTSSYVLFTAGLAMATFALCYWLTDVLGWRRWAFPFICFGANPLAIYFCAELLWHGLTRYSRGGVRLEDLLYQRVFEHVFSSAYDSSLLFAASYVCLFALLAWLMYRMKIFVRI